MHIIWSILAHSQIQQYRGNKNDHRWQVWILFCIWKKVLSKIVDMKLSDWTEILTPLLWNNIYNHHEHWWLPPLHLNIQSWLPIELGWQKGVVGLWAVSGSSSRPRLGMYSPGCHQWRQSRDLLLAKPQSWTMVAARSLLGGENNGFVVTTEHIQIDTIPSPHPGPEWVGNSQQRV